ncbi:MAG: hypothetical protein Ct9H300mP15_10200 [Gemmatimonadota bacterium]|nr:MAG: hypothetical protein Ct9H300mP15_10200 [Gemmatimonadota bacterium]
MNQENGLNRRAFLRNAGMTAVLGAVGTRGAFAEEIDVAESAITGQQVYDFDEVYNRVGLIALNGTVQSRLMVRRSKSAWVSRIWISERPRVLRRGLAERCEHENWGYLRRPASYVRSIVDWNSRRYGLDIDPSTVVLTTGVHPGLIAALHTFSPPGSRVLLTTPTYNGFYSDLRFTRTVASDSQMKVVDGKYSIDFEDFERTSQDSQCLHPM